jgi:hypothetical protein
MRVIEVDVIGAQPAQAVLDLLNDVAARQPGGRVEATFPGLGRDHHVVAPAGERTAQDQLCGFAFGGWRRTWPVEGRRSSVHVGGVEEVDAEIKRRLNHMLGFLRVRRNAECGRAQTDLRHLHPGRAEQ